MFMQEVAEAPPEAPPVEEEQPVDESPTAAEAVSEVATADAAIPQDQEVSQEGLSPEQSRQQQNKDALINKIIANDDSLQGKTPEVAQEIMNMYQGMPETALQEILGSQQERIQVREPQNAVELYEKWMGSDGNGGQIREAIGRKFFAQFQQEVLQAEQEELIKQAQGEHLQLFLAMQQDAVPGEEKTVDIEAYLKEHQADIETTFATKVRTRVDQRIEEVYDKLKQQDIEGVIALLVDQEKQVGQIEVENQEAETAGQVQPAAESNQEDASESDQESADLKEDAQPKTFKQQAIDFLKMSGISLASFTVDGILSSDAETLISLLCAGEASRYHGTAFRNTIENFDSKTQVGVAEFKELVRENKNSDESTFKAYDRTL
jgi:hypothetical protein